jgi:hypothetical protein
MAQISGVCVWCPRADPLHVRGGLHLWECGRQRGSRAIASRSPAASSALTALMAARTEPSPRASVTSPPGGTAERLGCACPGSRDRAQPVQRFALDLATAFLADPQAAADFLVGLGLVLIQAVAAD